MLLVLDFSTNTRSNSESLNNRINIDLIIKFSLTFLQQVLSFELCEFNNPIPSLFVKHERIKSETNKSVAPNLCVAHFYSLESVIDRVAIILDKRLIIGIQRILILKVIRSGNIGLKMLVNNAFGKTFAEYEE